MSRMSDEHICKCASERSDMLRKTSLDADVPLLSFCLIEEWIEAKLKLDNSEDMERLLVECKKSINELTNELLK